MRQQTKRWLASLNPLEIRAGFLRTEEIEMEKIFGLNPLEIRAGFLQIRNRFTGDVLKGLNPLEIRAGFLHANSVYWTPEGES